MKKLLNWVIAFVPTIIGIIEAALKFLKELITLVMDILFPIIPVAKFQAIVTWLRDKVDMIYTGFSKVKDKILAYLNLLPGS